MINMITQKQIQNLRKSVRYRRWMPWLILFVAVFFLFNAGRHLFFVHRICTLFGLTWNHVLSFTFTCPEPNQSYKGIEVLAADEIKMAMFYFYNMFIIALFYFIARCHRTKDILL